MKKLLNTLGLTIAILIASICNAQNTFESIPADFSKLTGSWQGSLTYLDYVSGKPYTMPADLEIKRTQKKTGFAFFNIYPNEKSANSTDTIIISKDGRYIDKEMVKSRTKLDNGDIEIITEQSGKDGNDDKPATFKITYTLGPTSFKITKDVQFTGETQWIKRHEYTYIRKAEQ